MSGTEIAFWVSTGLIGYAYAGYPLLIGLLSRCVPRPRFSVPDSAAASGLPTVSLIIAAYKEESVILQRIQNALEMDYPGDKIEILIGCDGNEDTTAELVRGVHDSRIRLMSFDKRRGKPSVLNDCAAAARGEILAFSDANTFWNRDALLRLVSPFRSRSVGGVCGQLLLTDPVTGGNVDGLYWRYENFLKRCEGRLGTLLGCNGAIYAMRRSLWKPIPPQTIIDDFLIGMRVHRQGQRLLFDESAIAHEESAPTVAAEFHRRARIGAGGFQSLCWLLPLLAPWYGSVAFAFWSHKVLRWLCPLFMVTALITNLLLALHHWGYATLLLGQLVFYGFAISGLFSPGRRGSSRLQKLSAMFVSMNAALAVGFYRWAGNRQSGAWKRTARTQEIPQTSVPSGTNG